MNESKAKAYLGQIRLMMARERLLQAEINVIRSELENVDVSIRSSWPDGQPHGSGKTDPVGEKAAVDVDAQIHERRKKLLNQLQDIELRLLRSKSDVYRKRLEVIENIEKVDDAECIDLLYLRYVRCETWEQIAVSMGFTYQWVAGRLHDKALKLMVDVMKKAKSF